MSLLHSTRIIRRHDPAWSIRRCRHIQHHRTSITSPSIIPTANGCHCLQNIASWSQTGICPSAEPSSCHHRHLTFPLMSLATARVHCQWSICFCDLRHKVCSLSVDMYTFACCRQEGAPSCRSDPIRLSAGAAVLPSFAKSTSDVYNQTQGGHVSIDQSLWRWSTCHPT